MVLRDERPLLLDSSETGQRVSQRPTDKYWERSPHRDRERKRPPSGQRKRIKVLSK